MQKLRVIIFLISITPSLMLAQQDTAVRILIPGNQENYLGPLVHYFPVLSNRPPLTSDMPMDIIIGYLLADSIAKIATLNEIDQYLEEGISHDYLKQAMKYAYILNNYDPVLFAQWGGIDSTNDYICSIGHVRQSLISYVARMLPGGKLFATLLSSDFIAHVRVQSVSRTIDSSAGWARHANLVHAEILESIKGEWLPICNNYDEVSFADAGSYKQRAYPGGCIEFDYRDEWERAINPLLTKGATNFAGWVEEGDEFIVFLKLVAVSGFADDTLHYSSYKLTTSPATLIYSTNGSMYKVVDGIVVDENNDFGFGMEISVVAWKTALYQAISQLINAE